MIQDCGEDLESRVAVSGDYGKRECGLDISHLTREDSGVWICEAIRNIIISDQLAYDWSCV